jgi:hypothetical protein
MTSAIALAVGNLAAMGGIAILLISRLSLFISCTLLQLPLDQQAGSTYRATIESIDPPVTVIQ